MWELLGQAASWLLLAFLSSQAIIFAGLVVWMVWIGSIKPRLIPADVIDRAVDDIIANHADPEEEAFARHERAWYRSDSAEQVYWYRVRKAIRRKLKRCQP